MKKILSFLVAATLSAAVSCSSGNEPKPSKNVIFMFVDGCSHDSPFAFSSGSSPVTAGGRTVELNVPAVCVSKSGRFFIPGNIIEQLK